MHCSERRMHTNRSRARLAMVNSCDVWGRERGRHIFDATEIAGQFSRCEFSLLLCIHFLVDQNSILRKLMAKIPIQPFDPSIGVSFAEFLGSFQAPYDHVPSSVGSCKLPIVYWRTVRHFNCVAPFSTPHRARLQS